MVQAGSWLAVQLGDYYAAARICGAPVPPPQVISRAVTFQVLLRCVVIENSTASSLSTHSIAYKHAIDGTLCCRVSAASLLA